MAGKPKNTGFPPKRGQPPSGFSFWEIKGWLTGLDAVVLGAGLVGSNAALRLKERYPAWRIVVLDRSSLGGASKRNAGFACFGSPSELLDDWKTLGPVATVNLVQMRWDGLLALRSAWGDAALGYRACGAVEAFTDPALLESCRTMLPELNDALEGIVGGAAFQHSAAATGMHGLAGVIHSPFEGDLDTAQLGQVLNRALHDASIPTLFGLDVAQLERRGDGWDVCTNQGVMHTPRVLVATNAWAGELLDVDVKPVPNHVVVSQPLPDLNLKQTIHHDKGYVYAREVDGRVLIGGGRQWACESDADRLDRLVEWAQTHIKGAQSMEIAHHWVGQLGIGEVREPVVKNIEPGLFAGVRLGGMGVAIGTLTGRKLADLV
ncbi:MAG: FAD-binding oxidoreductase [Flavobacteriales bacterium]|nr:FAD-binding oxidoreductase [Flavobacteriales bacterium]